MSTCVGIFSLITAHLVVIFQQPRPGPPLPKGEHYVTIGWKQIWIAMKQYKKLPYTFIYLVAFFLLADVRRFHASRTMTFLSRRNAGSQYHRDAGFHMSERQVPVLVLAEHVPGPVSSNYVHHQHARLLVHPAVLEDSYEEQGGPTAYLGSTVPDFPNFILISGEPNPAWRGKG